MTRRSEGLFRESLFFDPLEIPLYLFCAHFLLIASIPKNQTYSFLAGLPSQVVPRWTVAALRPKMKLTPEQIEENFKAGIYLQDACDKCSKLLAEIRYTKKGERGEWCSEICRDGVRAVAPKKPRTSEPEVSSASMNRATTEKRILKARIGRAAQKKENAAKNTL
jgi:hypothetical protein